MSTHDAIQQYLSGEPFAVVGASTDRSKYGNKVLRCYLQHGKKTFPVNPHADFIEGLPVSPQLQDLAEPVHGVSIITPPYITEQIVDDAIALGIRHLWMQPGAESETAVANAQAAGINVIAGGPCLLVVMGYHE